MKFLAEKKVNKFSVVDVIAVLTESADARTYWKVVKHRLIKEGFESVTNCNQLKLPAADGKKYTATIYADAKDAHYKTNPQAYTVSTKTVTFKTKLKLFTAAGGGCAIKIEEKMQKFCPKRAKSVPPSALFVLFICMDAKKVVPLRPILNKELVF